MTNKHQKINNFVVFQTETGKVNVEVFFKMIRYGLLKKSLLSYLKKGVLQLRNICKRFLKTENLTKKWTAEVLHQYIIKGFVMDGERFKQTKHFSLYCFVRPFFRINGLSNFA
jgi:hypothetical protein